MEFKKYDWGHELKHDYYKISLEPGQKCGVCKSNDINIMAIYDYDDACVCVCGLCLLEISNRLKKDLTLEVNNG